VQRRVRHSQLDLIAAVQAVQMPERGQVGGAMPRDGGGAGLAGEGSLRVVAWALGEIAGARALDDHDVDADAGDDDAPDRLPVANTLGEEARQRADLLPLAVDAADRLAVGGAGDALREVVRGPL